MLTPAQARAPLAAERLAALHGGLHGGDNMRVLGSPAPLPFRVIPGAARGVGGDLQSQLRGASARGSRHAHRQAPMRGGARWLARAGVGGTALWQDHGTCGRRRHGRGRRAARSRGAATHVDDCALLNKYPDGAMQCVITATLTTGYTGRYTAVAAAWRAAPSTFAALPPTGGHSR